MNLSFWPCGLGSDSFQSMDPNHPTCTTPLVDVRRLPQPLAYRNQTQGPQAAKDEGSQMNDELI